MNNNTTESGGIGITGILQIVFIVLKLCKVISWSWWVVMLPTIISAGIGVVALVIFGIFALGIGMGWW